MRCTRCGHEAAATDKFCAECGLFLRDAFADHERQEAVSPDLHPHSRQTGSLLADQLALGTLVRLQNLADMSRSLSSRLLNI